MAYKFVVCCYDLLGPPPTSMKSLTASQLVGHTLEKGVQVYLCRQQGLRYCWTIHNDFSL